ncbi:hypothetical protein BCR36DRAFT_368466 [Piromyces finnis]|uniref:Uncharacterized protein n=1 Tax=Piromyces finnis TaxID=1754191 RepID=A0A1Y1VFI0_9FUNG|nr:hypothetical protein BCR36DRAFT_368466 [Piromyces finnis]|eukprot:ORX54837.1 hypothetical protein BCR36DRAFT_368466 [Piromyces finnis]
MDPTEGKIIIGENFGRTEISDEDNKVKNEEQQVVEIEEEEEEEEGFDFDDDVIVNDDVEEDNGTSGSIGMSFSSALDSFRNAGVSYNTINPKEEGFDPNDIKGTAPKIFERLLDMDNPSLNKELYQILIDYDGIQFFLYLFKFVVIILDSKT